MTSHCQQAGSLCALLFVFFVHVQGHMFVLIRYMFTCPCTIHKYMHICTYTFMFVCEPIHVFAWTCVREATPLHAGCLLKQLLLSPFFHDALCVPSHSIKASIHVHVYACRA